MRCTARKLHRATGDEWAFLIFFRRSKPPIKDVGQLADFIDEQSAFLVQKGIYDYVRARSGHYAKVMLADKGFQNALDRSRWRAYPLGLAMVGETIEGMLAVQSMEDRRGTLDPLIEVVLSVFDRYPKPEAVSDEEWKQARGRSGTASATAQHASTETCDRYSGALRRALFLQ